MDEKQSPVRLATLDDCSRLAEIENCSFPEGYAGLLLSESDFRALISSPDEVVFCYCDPEGILGYAHLELADDRRSADFDSLAVAPSAQGKGVGEVLFKHVEAYCGENSIPVLNLRIKEDNYRLLQRYHRFGYKIFEIVPNYYSDGWAALRMNKLTL